LPQAAALKVLLREMEGEIPVPLFHHLPSLAQALGLRRHPSRNAVLAALKRRGFASSHSHVAVHLAQNYHKSSILVGFILVY
jgi:tRNA G26 N,N-dimethylase Trm1